MSAFKDQITADIGSVFLNGDEFGEKHTINGTEMVCTIDSDDLQRRGPVKIYNGSADNLAKGDVRIFVAADVFGPKPKPGSIITLDTAKRRVVECRAEGGVYAILVEAMR